MVMSNKLFSEADEDERGPEEYVPPPMPEGSVAASLRELGGPSPSLAGGKPAKSVDASRAGVKFELIPIDQITPDPDQPRKTIKKIQELKDALDAEGMLQPIVVRATKGRYRYTIKWGERRWRAAQMAGWSHIPAIIHAGVDTSLLKRQLMENSQREPLDPIDEAQALRRFMREEKIATMAECAQKLGHHTSYVATRLALLDLDEEDQEAVSEGALPMYKAAQKSRQMMGTARTKSKGKTKVAKAGPVTTTMAGHFDLRHHLASRARAKAARHQCSPRSYLPGGMACGQCWESVIRTDEAARWS